MTLRAVPMVIAAGSAKTLSSAFLDVSVYFPLICLQVLFTVISPNFQEMQLQPARTESDMIFGRVTQNLWTYQNGHINS